MFPTLNKSASDIKAIDNDDAQNTSKIYIDNPNIVNASTESNTTIEGETITYTKHNFKYKITYTDKKTLCIHVKHNDEYYPWGTELTKPFTTPLFNMEVELADLFNIFKNDHDAIVYPEKYTSYDKPITIKIITTITVVNKQYTDEQIITLKPIDIGTESRLDKKYTKKINRLEEKLNKCHCNKLILSNIIQSNDAYDKNNNLQTVINVFLETLTSVKKDIEKLNHIVNEQQKQINSLGSENQDIRNLVMKTMNSTEKTVKLLNDEINKQHELIIGMQESNVNTVIEQMLSNKNE